MRLKSREAREFRRQMIVKLRSSGKRQEEIAILLAIDQSVVSRVLKKHSIGESLDEKVNKGASAKLSPSQLAEFSEMIKKGAESFGFLGDQWSAKRLVYITEDQFKIRYSESGILKVVKRLGFTKQRYQQKDIRQPDTEKWKSEKLVAIKKSTNE